MKLCIVAGKRTREILSYLKTNFRSRVEISVWFPQEERSHTDTDIIISETESSFPVSQILSLEDPPLIIIMKDGISTKKIRYVKDISMELPEIIESLCEKEPVITFSTRHESYVYPQREVVSIVKEQFLHVTFRSGKKAVYHHGLRRLLEGLSREYFFRVGDKTCVNALYVSKFCPDGILMQNGIFFPCSQEQLKKAENAFYRTKFCQNSLKKEKKSAGICANTQKIQKN